MAEGFSRAVEDGLKLSKRVYFGKNHDDDVIVPPRLPPPMQKFDEQFYLPTSPMVYAVIYDPGTVDNPDLPSYQPHVYGTCDPPALIPLQMSGVDLAVECFLDTAFVTFSGSWRVHCVKRKRSCDCRLAFPMGEQGSILGLEVETPRKTFSTRLVAEGTEMDPQKPIRAGDGSFLKPHIFTVTIPKNDGGSELSIKVSWSQKLLYKDGEFSFKMPFIFPEYVTPIVKKNLRKERVHFNVNVGTETEVLFNKASHPLKEVNRLVGKLDYFYEYGIRKWSKKDFNFSYTVTSKNMFGGVLLQSPSVHDVDQREMFCAFIMPGNETDRKVFRKDVVFVIDISGSMVGKLLESTKNALYESLSKLDPEDSFNVIAFNGERYLFSTSMELATKEAVERATQWIGINFISGGSTDILPALTQAVDMLSDARGSIPTIILVTDGTVENERQICDEMKSHLIDQKSICPRLHTFGIGTYCNHHFLRMLAMIGRGHYDAALDVDTIESRLQNLIIKASSVALANITIDTLDDLEEVEVYPSCIPDLSPESPLIIYGRYRGVFPENLKAKGTLPDSNTFLLDLEIQKSKDIPIDKVCAKQQVDLLTAQAWYSQDKQIEDKVAKISIQTGIVSEYTRMFVGETIKGMITSEQVQNHMFLGDTIDTIKGLTNQVQGLWNTDGKMEPGTHRLISLPSLTIGFGNLTATIENLPPGAKEPRTPIVGEVLVKATRNCCSEIFGCCCCVSCLHCCVKLSNQGAVVLTQCFTTLACYGCFECWSAFCCPDDG